jgi:hypothetical protein
MLEAILNVINTPYEIVFTVFVNPNQIKVVYFFDRLPMGGTLLF